MTTRNTIALTVALGSLLFAVPVPAQTPTAAKAPWRGAGATPCVGTDGGVSQCPSAPGVIVIRAGRMFNSTTGQMLSKQVIAIAGDRIIQVGPEA